MEPPTKKHKQYARPFQLSWNDQFQGVVTSSKLGSNHAWCTVCCRNIQVAASGVYDVSEHLKSKMHKQQLKCPQVTSFFKPKTADSADSTNKAELLFAYFVTEHNLPTSLGIHFTDLARQMFPDRSWNGVYRRPPQCIVERCQNGLFSIMIVINNQICSTLAVFATWLTSVWRLVWSNCQWLWTTCSSTCTSTSRTGQFTLFFYCIVPSLQCRMTVWLGPFRLDFVYTFRIMCIN